MILMHEDSQAIEKAFGSEQTEPVIYALEEPDKEQRMEVKRELLMEFAGKSDIAAHRTEMVENIAALRMGIAGV